MSVKHHRTGRAAQEIQITVPEAVVIQFDDPIDITFDKPAKKPKAAEKPIDITVPVEKPAKQPAQQQKQKQPAPISITVPAVPAEKPIEIVVGVPKARAEPPKPPQKQAGPAKTLEREKAKSAPKKTPAKTEKKAELPAKPDAVEISVPGPVAQPPKQKEEAASKKNVKSQKEKTQPLQSQPKAQNRASTPPAQNVSQQDVNDWKSQFKQQITTNIMKDFSREKFEQDPKYRQQVVQFQNDNPLETVVKNNPQRDLEIFLFAQGYSAQAFEKAFAMLVQEANYKQLVELYVRYGQRIFQVKQFYQQLKERIASQLQLLTPVQADFEVFALFYFYDFSHVFMKDSEVVAILDQLMCMLLSDCNKQLVREEVVQSLSCLMTQNQNQFFYKFKMFRAKNTDYATVEHFDAVLAKLLHFVQIMTQHARINNNVLYGILNKLAFFCNEFREFAAGDPNAAHYRVEKLPIIMTPRVSGYTGVVPESIFTRFQEDAANAKQLLREQSITQVFSQCLERNCVSLFAKCLEEKKPTDAEVAQVLRLLFLKLDRCGGPLHTCLARFVGDSAQLKAFVVVLARYQYCLTGQYVAQAAREFLAREVATRCFSPESEASQRLLAHGDLKVVAAQKFEVERFLEGLSFADVVDALQ